MPKKEIKRILIADDKKPVLKSLELLLEDYFEEVVCVSNPNLIPNLVWEKPFDVYLLDMNFSAGVSSGNEGIYWLNKIRAGDEDAVIVFMTAYGDVALAVKAVKEGAFDFVLKPWDNHTLVSTLKAAFSFRNSNKQIARLKKKEAALVQELSGSAQMISGSSPIMKEINARVKKVAVTNANVLITGENGTGKGLLALDIHRHSKRKNHVFLSVDISSLPSGLIESELFGHKKGAFTGADSDRIGKFEAASGGTIFLDEIGNLDLHLQTKLLSVIQNMEITPLGSNQCVPLDVHLICATNNDLPSMVKEGTFREDLYYRINTVILELPSLKNRREDILALTKHFIHHYSGKYNKKTPSLSNRAEAYLEKYSWPGNVRELQHSVERAIILSDSHTLTEKDFQFRQLEETGEKINLVQPLENLERTAIQQAIQQFDGNLTRVASELKVSRQTLYNKIKKHGL